MRRKWLLLIPLILIVVYFSGPHPDHPVYSLALPAVPAEPSALVTYISNKESMHRLKPDNEARIIWVNDSLKQKTDYSIVYLHGFSASQAEGDPVHRNIAKKYGCNLYLSRLAEHGVDTVDALANLKAEEYWESAKEALAIGKQLGNKVILMGTSTGGTFALMLAARFPDVHALVLLSPNIAINNPGAPLLNNPWGLQIASLALPDNHIHSKDQREIFRQYWNSEYSVKAAIELEELLETSMNESTFKKVHQPVLNLYYYKDAIQQDSVVKVSAIKTMMQQLGTPEGLKRSIAFPKAGTHVIGSYIRSGDVEGVQQAIDRFMAEVLHLKPYVTPRL